MNLTHNISTNNGAISIIGTAGGQDGTMSSRGINKTGGIITVGGDHDLNLVTDSATLSGNSSLRAEGNHVIVRQKTAGTAIVLGAEDIVSGGPLTLGLSDAELDTFMADEVRVGNADTGAVSVAGVISPLSYPLLRLAKAVTFASSGGFSADITSESVFERMIVNGGITLEAGSSLVGTVIGGFVPTSTAVIPVIQGTGGVTGTFTGLAEGTPVSLTGLARRMRLTYAVGGGNHIAFYSSPIMVMRGNGVGIANGDATPSSTDHTDFGEVLTEGASSLTRNFTVYNDGLAPLTGISASVGTGTPAGVFTRATTPADALAPGVLTSFYVVFDPAANGLQTSTVTVTSDQPLDSPYSFAIQGLGTGPVIVIEQPVGNALANGVSTVDFGTRAVPSTTSLTFTVRNTGTAALNLTGVPLVSITGDHAAEFTVTSAPAALIAAPGSTTFEITFSPAASGLRTASVRVLSDASATPDFTFAISGTGAGAAVPQTEVVESGTWLNATEGLLGGGRIARPLAGVINQAGFVTFRATGSVGTGGITSGNDSLLLSNSSGSLQVVAREGHMVEVSPWSTLAGAFGHFLLTDQGQSVALDRILGAPTSRDYAYLASPEGVALEILSREGDAAPSAGTFKTHTAKPAADSLGRVYFSGSLMGTGITTKDDTGIYQESSGTLVEIIREGDDVSALTTDPAWLGAVSNYVAAAADGVAFTALLQNNPADAKQKTDTARNALVLAGNESGLEILARKGDGVPDLSGATLKSFSGVSRAAADSHAYLALMNTGSGITTANDQVLVAVTATGSYLVAREGVTQAEGVTLVKFADFYATRAGAVIFEASGVLCRWTEAEGIAVLARLGGAAPGTGSTHSAFTAWSVSEGGAVALHSRLANGRNVLWRALPGEMLTAVIGTGDLVEVSGTDYPVLTLTLHNGGSGTGGGGGGMGAAINDAGEVFVSLSLGGSLHVGRVLR